MSDLKSEWLEKIKVVEKRKVHYKSSLFTVMTYFYIAPDEIRNDREMCLKVLLEANEYIWNIPKKLRTLDLYEELFQKGYKHSLLDGQVFWSEDIVDFLDRYLSSFKTSKPSFDYIINKGAFANIEIVLDFVRKDYLSDIDFLLENYKKDKEIMFALLDNHPNKFKYVLKSIKNSYLKNEDNIFKLLSDDVYCYRYFTTKFQIVENVIDYVLSQLVFLFIYLKV